jgi:hypothetical protein
MPTLPFFYCRLNYRYFLQTDVAVPTSNPTYWFYKILDLFFNGAL